MNNLLTPLLSDYDPKTSSEGTLDPLGLFAIADSLALKLVSGVRERQSHPRFLTAIAVSAVVCSDFDEDIVAADNISEPWQVFEWYMVEGLVRTFGESDEILGLPGRDKAKRALNNNLPLSANNYLKTPSVFGFHGVYKVLAQNLDIVNDSWKLGANGYNLISIWEREHDSEGFHSKENGHGKTIRDQLSSAVKDGLQKGAVARSSGWNGWTIFKEYLAPYRFKTKEIEAIREALTISSSDFRRQVIEFLVSNEGQKVWIETESERDFHEALNKKATLELRTLLDAIVHYEEFSRLLQDAFDDCLMLMTQKKAKITTKELSMSKNVLTANSQVPELYHKVMDHLQPFNEDIRFSGLFSAFSVKTDAVSWVELLIEHHNKIQKNKPPNGKNPWFERFDDGSVVIRPGYRRDQGGSGELRRYVHPYRTRPLLSFAKDLRMISI